MQILQLSFIIFEASAFTYTHTLVPRFTLLATPKRALYFLGFYGVG